MMIKINPEDPRNPRTLLEGKVEQGLLKEWEGMMLKATWRDVVV